MKRILSLILAVLMLFSLAACQSSGNAGSETTTTAGYEGTLTELVAELYKDNTPEFMVGEAMPIEITDNDAVFYYFGLSSGEKLKEAVFSEPMMGSQAYSLCLARLNDAADAEDVKKEIAENIDMRKWICVGADQLRVVSAGDVVLMIMIDSSLDSELAGNIVTAFETACGGVSGTSHSKG